MYLIREMEREDVEVVSKIEEETFSMPWSKEDFLEMIEADYAHYFVAVETKENCLPIACCGVRIIAGEGQITNVVVAKAYRRKGIALRLMDRMIESARNEGAEAFTLEVRVSNIAAIHLYERLGFKSEGIRRDFYEKPKENALIMWKR